MKYAFQIIGNVSFLLTIDLNFLNNSLFISLPAAAILDHQSACGRGERMALGLARENINSMMDVSSKARVEVDMYELQKDSQYDTTDTSTSLSHSSLFSPSTY